MNNTGRIIASDIYRRKLDLIDREAKRLGITNIETRSWDATRVDSDVYKRQLLALSEVRLLRFCAW